MTDAARRRTLLAPLAAALAIACLALAAWSAAARADVASPVDSATDPVTGTADSGSTPDPGTTPDPHPAPTPPANEDPTPPPHRDPDGTTPPVPPADPAPIDPAPGDQTTAPGAPPAETPDPRTTDHWSDGSTGTAQNRDQGSSSAPSASTPAATVEPLPPLVPDDALAVPLTQFQVLTGSSSGGSTAGATLLAGAVHIGCLTLCPGASRLVGAIRLALAHEARSSARETTARVNGTAAKITALSLFGAAGAGGAGLFNLLVGGGGTAGAVVFVFFLAILMGLFALPRDWTSDFRLPPATWRPSAYVTPIELPG
jgi:hypothetical protein